MDFDTFIDTGWTDHADRPQEVADRLAASLEVIAAPAQVIPFARLAAHVLGEHLGQWQRGVDLLESLRRHPAFDGSADVADALTRNIAALRFAGGNPDALEPLSREERIAALAIAASALAGCGDMPRALDAYTTALRLAEPDLPDGSPAIRALAIGGNNLAAALETRAGRTAGETAGMLVAAQGGLRYWKLAGTWLEEERAEYRLARSLLQAGDAHGARDAARRCIDVCDRNGAPAFERFFGHAALALAYRAGGDRAAFEASRGRARELYAEVDADERQWCEAELGELGA